MKCFFFFFLSFVAINCFAIGDTSVDEQLQRGVKALHSRLESYGKTPSYLLDSLERASRDFNYFINDENLNFLLRGVRCYHKGNISYDDSYAFADWPFEPELKDVEVFGKLAYESRIAYFDSLCTVESLDVQTVSSVYEAVADMCSPEFYEFYDVTLAESLVCLYSLMDNPEIGNIMSSYIGEDTKSYGKNILFLISAAKTRNPEILYESYSDYLVSVSVSVVKEISELVSEGEMNERLLTLMKEYKPLEVDGRLASEVTLLLEKHNKIEDLVDSINVSSSFRMWGDFFNEFEMRSSLGNSTGINGLTYRYDKLMGAYASIGGKRELLTSILVNALAP